jgi:hypothetical protein
MRTLTIHTAKPETGRSPRATWVGSCLVSRAAFQAPKGTRYLDTLEPNGGLPGG